MFINLYFPFIYFTLYTWTYGACLCVCPAQSLEAIKQSTMLALSFHLWWDLVFVFHHYTGQGISSMSFMVICVFAFFFSLWSLELEILMLLCLAWYLFWGLKPRSSHCGAMLFQLSSPHPSLLFKQECFIYLHGLWLVFYEHLNNL